MCHIRGLRHSCSGRFSGAKLKQGKQSVCYLGYCGIVLEACWWPLTKSSGMSTFLDPWLIVAMASSRTTSLQSESSWRRSPTTWPETLARPQISGYLLLGKLPLKVVGYLLWPSTPPLGMLRLRGQYPISIALPGLEHVTISSRSCLAASPACTTCCLSLWSLPQLHPRTYSSQAISDYHVSETPATNRF